jgi:hypothetical protein
MSEATLKRIEKAIRRLTEQQDAICEKLASIEQRVEETGGASAPSSREVIAFLDRFRAGEALGEVSLGAWIAVSDTPCLRGALARFPDIDRTFAPIHELADRLDGDQETQSLLRTIAQDERSTLEFLVEACRQLNG